MRKSVQKMLAVAAAAVMALGVASLAACGSGSYSVGDFPKDYETVESNGGFIVGVGNYYYFINGVETYSSNNTYGKPVKGSLMRVKKDDALAGKTVDEEGNPTSEIVVPSLMVAGDTTAGIFVYGDRVYYATPTTVRNTEGNVQNTYLDYKSAKLDGSAIEEYVRLASNTTVYRYVEVKDTVYLLYVEAVSSSYTIHSFNTKTNTDTVLVKNATSYRFNDSDKTDPTVYYTMGVTEKPDSRFAVAKTYNQIYRVSADTLEAPYEYDWDWDYINDNPDTFDGEAPYVNLGTIVLDGVGERDFVDRTKFNHSDTTPKSPVGYFYSLSVVQNGGIYFSRRETATSGSAGSNGSLYFLDLEDVTDSWDSIGANDNEIDAFDMIARDAASSTLSSAYFYREDSDGDGELEHHYFYVDGSNLVRVDISDVSDTVQDIEEEEQTIAFSVSSPKIIGIDNTSHHSDNAIGTPLHYVYYANSLSDGNSINRVAYNGEAINYGTMEYENNIEYYKETRILDLQYRSDWYDFELIDNTIFFADANLYGSNTFSYINTVSLEKGGKLMDSVQLKELNDKYDAITSTDSKNEGLLSKVASTVNTRLRIALEYYFWTGEDRLFRENIQEAIDAELDDDELPYNEKERDAFKAFVDGDGYTYNDKDLFKEGDFVDEDGVSYRTRSYFVKSIGYFNDADEEAFDNYWKITLAHYTPPTVEPFKLPGWATALIVIGSIYVCYLVAVFTIYGVKAREEKRANAPKAQRMHVDTTDDKDIDVYAAPEEPVPETELEEAAPEADSEPAEELTEESADEPAEAPEETTEE